MATVIVAALAAAVASRPVPISAPVVGVAVWLVVAVVLMVPSRRRTVRLGAGLSPELRKGPTPIDRYAKIFLSTCDPALRVWRLLDRAGECDDQGVDHGEGCGRAFCG
ncbi:hypothetical protein GCM10029963_17830 [Micromonospora andamanensis]|nr:hypothetical protein Vwe01_44000 [Micromonospora andamanensis]